MTPTQRTLALLRQQGYFADVVERYCSFTRRRHDLFGFLDVVAINLDAQGVLGIQTTSGSNLSARVAKIMASEQAEAWLESGNRIVVHGWKKYAKKVDGKNWRCREQEIELADFTLARC